MNTHLATWTDADNNRQIQFSVAYTTENSGVEIGELTATKVSFICPETNTCLRSVGVHTEKGRTMLAEQFRAKGDLKLLAERIAASTQERVAV